MGATLPPKPPSACTATNIGPVRKGVRGSREHLRWRASRRKLYAVCSSITHAGTGHHVIGPPIALPTTSNCTRLSLSSIVSAAHATVYPASAT